MTAPAALLLLAVAAAPAGPPADDALWARLRGDGAVVLVRHALAPGTRDPPGFRLGDCETQRNLSEEGRAQARRMGEALRARGARIGKVLSSRWCRARDTAALAFGAHEPWPALDSYLGDDRGDLPARAARIREAISAWSGPGALVLVSHQFVLGEVVPGPLPEGVLVVLEPRREGAFAVLGRIDLREDAPARRGEERP